MTLETLLGHDVDDEGPEFDKGYDGLLAARFVHDESAHRGPGVTMLHFASTHVPYFVDEAHAPFRPYTRRVSWSDMPALHNAYKNSILAQDVHVAACVAAFVRAQRGGPWIVLFTSDHGEAFGEHGGIHHGQNLRAEQVRVPAWLASGGGALTDAELAAARDHRGRVLSHLDVLPTLLDGFRGGVGDDGDTDGDRERGTDVGADRDADRNMDVDGGIRDGRLGRSLLRPAVAMPPLPVTNCTTFFPCPLDTWGLRSGELEILAQPWDQDWQCHRLDTSAAGTDDEALPAETPGCVALRVASQRVFPTRPGGKPNRFPE